MPNFNDYHENAIRRIWRVLDKTGHAKAMNLHTTRSHNDMDLPIRPQALVIADEEGIPLIFVSDYQRHYPQYLGSLAPPSPEEILDLEEPIPSAFFEFLTQDLGQSVGVLEADCMVFYGLLTLPFVISGETGMYFERIYVRDDAYALIKELPIA